MLTEEEKSRLRSTLYDWHFIHNAHKRGCFLEALAQELENGTESKEYVAEVLRGIANLMK